MADRTKKPNIPVIPGNDIGIPQISAYSMGLMGSLNAGGIGYGMLKAQQALRRLKEIETFHPAP
jgi:hypothetical protein